MQWSGLNLVGSSIDLQRAGRDIWGSLLYFKREEFEPGAEHIKAVLLRKLDAMREWAGPIVIHGAYATDGHSTYSFHYKGMAADLHIAGYDVVDQYLIAERFGFGGLGIYPSWNEPGIHVDIRPVPQYGPLARWVAFKHPKTGKQTYGPLTASVIRGILRG